MPSADSVMVMTLPALATSPLGELSDVAVVAIFATPTQLPSEPTWEKLPRLQVTVREPNAVKPGMHCSVQEEPDGVCEVRQLGGTTIAKAADTAGGLHGFGEQNPVMGENCPALHGTANDPTVL